MENSKSIPSLPPPRPYFRICAPHFSERAAAFAGSNRVRSISVYHA